MSSNLIEYERHQRDYSILGTSVVFHAYQSKRTQEFFSLKETHPYYILVENDNLWHFTPKIETRIRATHYLLNKDLRNILLDKKKHDKILGLYRRFINAQLGCLRDDFEKIFLYFFDLLPLILVAIEVPEYVSDQNIVDVCFKIRRENEDVYKVGIDKLREMLFLLEDTRELKRGVLSYLTHYEFLRYLKDGVLPGKLYMRGKFVLVKQYQEKESIFYNPEKLKSFGLNQEQNQNNLDVRGVVACRGIVCGRVKVVRTIKDLFRIKNGDVIVAPMTDPRYFSALKKVSAIITDEGGITCHAAIIARELKKPCIIGTKIATKVLKDGDLVEVDAEKGVVTILQRVGA